MISLLASTRKRVDSLLRMWKSAIDTATKPEDLQLVLYIDDDDIETRQAYNSVQPSVLAVIGPRLHILGQGINECYKACSGDICMVCTDDIVFRTPSWDDMVRDTFLSFTDKIMMVFGEDGIQHGSMATLPFISRNWIESVGYVLPPYFVNEFGDKWITDVAFMLKRYVYLPGMLIEHQHHYAGKMEVDSTVTERERMRGDHTPEGGWMAYYDSLLYKRKKDVAKLQAVIARYGRRS